MVQINPRVANFPIYPFAILAARRRDLQAAGTRIFDFSKGDPVEPTPEFIKQALIAAVPAISQYPAVKGLPELRAAVSAYCKRRFGVNLNAETEVLHCNGTKEAIYNLTAAVIGPEAARRKVILADPSYPVVERSNTIFSGEPYLVPLTPENNFLIDLAQIPEKVLQQTALVWLNYPNNPTAACCTKEYLQRQIEIAKRYDILVCSDECYIDLYLNDVPPPSALEISTEGVVVFQSCSKRSGMTGYRTGFIAGDKTVLKAFLSLRDTIGTESPAFIQHAAIAAWGDDEHAAKRRDIFRAKRDLFVKFFVEVGLEHAACDATFYLWLKAPNGMSGSEYAERLMKHGILVVPGEFFGSCCTDRVRVALVPSLEESKAAIEVWRGV